MRPDEQTQAELAALIEFSEDAIVTKTLEGRIVSWNRSAERIFGYSAAEAIGQSITFLMFPDRVDEETHILARLSRGERIEHYETIRRHKDGRALTISLSISPIKNKKGHIIGAAKIARDITAVKQRERERELLLAREREARNQAEALNAIAAVLSAERDLEGLLQKVTDTATRVTGAKFGAFFYNAVDDRGESFLLYTLSGAPKEAFAKFGSPRNTPIFAPTFHGKGPIRLDDVQQDPRYGQLSPHFGMPAGHLPVRSYLAVPVMSRKGVVLGGLFFGHPEPGQFTETAERLAVGIAAQAAVGIEIAQLLKQEQSARQEAERANRLKDEFLATVSHELRTPLTGIMGWAQVLQETQHDDAVTKRAVGGIARAAQNQMQLVNDLLDVSRIVTGQLKLEVKTVDFVSIVQSALETVRLMAKAKHIDLRLSAGPIAGCLNGDPDRLQQVVWNLLTNAIKFTPRGGTVRIEVGQRNGDAVFTVADNGIGIKKWDLPVIFERFTQGDSSSTRTQSGLGLGLSIVKYIVEMHGGIVSAESAGPGQGATFTVTLPLLEPGQDRLVPPSGPAPAAVPSALKGIRVLVVDDEQEVLDLLSLLLSQAGSEVRVSHSAQETLDLLDTWQPDILICDIAMPQEDGYSLIRRVRRRLPEEGGQIPAVAITAYARSEDRALALNAGFQEHIPKPFQKSQIIDVVAGLVKRG